MIASTSSPNDSTNISRSRLIPGFKLDAFSLETIQGKSVAIPDPDRLIHLQFRRYAGCPICNLHLRSVARRAGEISSAGVHEVVVFHSPVEDMLPYQGDLPFDSVADPQKNLYRRFGVESGKRAITSPRAILAALKGMLSTKPTGKTAGGKLGLPAEFLISRTGEIVAAKYGEHAADQWSVDELLAEAKKSATR